MANRSPQGDTGQYPSMPAWRPPQPGSYAPPDTRGHHAHDGERELHAQGDLPHYHDPDSGILVFFDPVASAPNGAATEVDPIPATFSPSEAAAPDAGDASEPALTGGSGGAAGSGRPIRARDSLGRFAPSSSLPPGAELRRIQAPALPVSVALEHALIEYDADHFLEMQHYRLRTARTVLDAIRFGLEADRLEDAMAMYAGMLVRLPSDDGRRP